jgi:hypothetical protein
MSYDSDFPVYLKKRGLRLLYPYKKVGRKANLSFFLQESTTVNPPETGNSAIGDKALPVKHFQQDPS